MGKSQREKGKRGERELAGILKGYGYACRRGQQFCGADGSADVVGLPGMHIECKRVERLNILDAVEQSVRDAREGELPVVFHRRDRSEWQPCDWRTGYRFSGNGKPAGRSKGSR